MKMACNIFYLENLLFVGVCHSMKRMETVAVIVVAIVSYTHFFEKEKLAPPEHLANISEI